MPLALNGGKDCAAGAARVADATYRRKLMTHLADATRFYWSNEDVNVIDSDGAPPELRSE
jgi:hypothetical protein